MHYHDHQFIAASEVSESENIEIEALRLVQDLPACLIEAESCAHILISLFLCEIKVSDRSGSPLERL